MGALEKASTACNRSENKVHDHFVQVDKMVEIGSGAKRKQVDYKLSRYACYLIVQNSDPRKEVVALGQTYFAVQTRKQELSEKNIVVLLKMKKILSKRFNKERKLFIKSSCKKSRS